MQISQQTRYVFVRESATFKPYLNTWNSLISANDFDWRRKKNRFYGCKVSFNRTKYRLNMTIWCPKELTSARALTVAAFFSSVASFLARSAKTGERERDCITRSKPQLKWMKDRSSKTQISFVISYIAITISKRIWESARANVRRLI